MRRSDGELVSDALMHISVLRKHLAHGYAYIDMSIVTAPVVHDLPWLEDRLREEAILATDE